MRRCWSGGSRRIVRVGVLVALIGLSACGPTGASPSSSASKPALAGSQPAAPAAAAGAPAASQAAAAPAEQEPYKIGATYVLSGDQAEYSRRQLVGGMQMAIDDLNEAGGVNGRRFAAVLEDSGGQQAQGVAALRKLIDVDRVPVVHTIYTFITYAQIPIAEETKTFLFAPGVEHPELTTRSQWTARATLNSLDNGLLMADVNEQRLGYKRVAIIYEDQEGIIGLTKAFRDRLTQQYGGQVVGEEAYKQGDTDFRNHIAKLRPLNPDMVFIVGALSVEKPRVIKQIREAGWNVPITTNAPFEDQEVLNVGGAALEGTLFITTTFTQEWADRFTRKYGYLPDNIAAKHYDGMMLTGEAIRRGSYTGEGIRQALNGIAEYEGAQGKLTNNGQREWKPGPSVKAVRDGKFVTLQ